MTLSILYGFYGDLVFGIRFTKKLLLAFSASFFFAYFAYELSFMLKAVKLNTCKNETRFAQTVILTAYLADIFRRIAQCSLRKNAQM